MTPPDIYGEGYGPARRASAFVPMFVQEATKLGYTFFVRDGENTRSWVHIDDLLQVYLKLIEAAVDGGKGADWGKQVCCTSSASDLYRLIPMQGYYFTSTQELSQKQAAEAVGKILVAQGVIETAEPRQIPIRKLDEMVPHRFAKLGVYLFASNSRTSPHRAEQLFGFKATAPSFWDVVESDVLATLRK